MFTIMKVGFVMDIPGLHSGIMCSKYGMKIGKTVKTGIFYIQIMPLSGKLAGHILHIRPGKSRYHVPDLFHDSRLYFFQIHKLQN